MRSIDSIELLCMRIESKEKPSDVSPDISLSIEEEFVFEVDIVRVEGVGKIEKSEFFSIGIEAK